MSEKTVLVLGGGVGGMSAAWALAHAPSPPRIRVLQMGWRLGGKGASGRRMQPGSGARIEEHGVHVWSGLYENAFTVLRQAYEESGRTASHPQRTIDDAFFPHNNVVLMEQWNGAWIPWEIVLPYNHLSPGFGQRDVVPDTLTLLWQMIRWAVAVAFEQPSLLGPAPSLCSAPDRSPRWIDSWARAAVLRFLSGRTRFTSPELLVAALEQLVSRLWPWYRHRLDDNGHRRAWIVLNFALANVVGTVRDRALSRGFDALDEHDYLDWLRRFAVDDGGVMLSSPLARFLYDAEFAYVDGDLSRPNIAAGASLRTLLRMSFSWRGSLLWKMRGGMGDVVFAPMYQALRRRGVEFSFFHRVERLCLSPDRSCVSSVIVAVQARVRAAEYQPFVSVRGVECWPSEPLWDQLAPSAAVSRRDHFEDPSTVAEERVELVAGRDFDQIVLATPVDTHRTIAAELVDHSPAWRRSTEHVRTVATQAVQLWLRRDSQELGWSGAAHPLLGSFQESPLNTWVDMSHVLDWEAWDAPAPASVAYFCGPLPESTQPDIAAREHARALFAGPIRWLWKSSRAADFRSLSAGTATDRALSDCVVDSYIRHNSWPSERFTLSLAGSTAHRLSPLRSCFANLSIAGDWTANGFNIGNVEAATMSGLLAAHSLCGYPALDSIVGLGFGQPAKGAPLDA